jgi:hypothetical protein
LPDGASRKVLAPLPEAFSNRVPAGSLLLVEFHKATGLARAVLADCGVLTGEAQPAMTTIKPRAAVVSAARLPPGCGASFFQLIAVLVCYKF